MGNEEFKKVAESIVYDYTIKQFKGNQGLIPEFEIYTVWSCKTLQNNKALISTSLNDHMYYEVTYNGDKEEIYFDAYKKEKNICIKK